MKPRTTLKEAAKGRGDASADLQVGRPDVDNRTHASAAERVTQSYESHRDRVYRFLVRQGLNPAVAQEVAQDVFCELFMALEKGIEVESEQAWLYTVAGRAVVNHWRREGRPMWVELDSDPGVAAMVPSREASPEAQAARRERLSQVAADLRRLPKEQQLCIHLRMKGLRYREIAEILHISTSTAAEWLATAVERVSGASNE